MFSLNESETILLVGYFWRRQRQRIKILGQSKKVKQDRSVWVRPMFEENARERFGAGHNLIQEMRLNDHLKYKNFFRMGPNAFDELLDLLTTKVKTWKKSDLGKKPIDSATRLAITLRYLAAGDSMVSLSYLFRVGVITISQIVAETTKAIWEVLMPICVKAPTENTWMENAEGFRGRWNFPNGIGAIDGKHVVIQAPPHAGSSFYNYKGSHSIVLLAVVDHQYTFSLIDVGAQGRQSDGGVLKNSAFGQSLFNGTLDLPASQKISADTPLLPFIIVGDEAFPLLQNLLKPYSSKQGLTIEKRIFNYRLSRARRISENAFGILIARWRIYGRNMMGKLENIDYIVKATIALHNFIMRNHRNSSYITPRLIDREQDGVIIPGAWRNYTSQLRPTGRVGSNTYRRNAKDIRDEFCRYFNEEGAVPWQWDNL